MNTRIIMMMLALIVCSFSVNAQRKELRTEKNGFKWYKSFEHFFYSAESADGNTLIPISRQYKSIIFIPSNFNKGYFLVRKNNKEGVCDITGKEIIAPDKYSTVNFHEEKGHVGWYSVKNNGLMGACDITGKEIIPCDNNLLFYGPDDQFINMDRSHNMIALGVKLDNNGKMIERNNAATTSPKESSTKQKSISNTSTITGRSKTNSYSDVLAFDLKGKVKSCEVITVTILDIAKFLSGKPTFFDGPAKDKVAFTSNGKYIPSKGESVEYEDGLIYDIRIGEDRTVFVFEDGRLSVKNFTGEFFGSFVISLYTYIYDNQGRIIKEKCHTNAGDIDTTYSDYELDSKGNWVKRIGKIGDGLPFGEVRRIEYY